jgi:hypothetical protein
VRADVKVWQRGSLLPASPAVGQEGLARDEARLVRQGLAPEVSSRDGIVEVLDAVESGRDLCVLDRVPTAADLVEAYVRAGPAVPQTMVESVIRHSEEEEFPGNAAIAWRCRGLIAADGEYQECSRARERTGQGKAAVLLGQLYAGRHEVAGSSQ